LSRPGLQAAFSEWWDGRCREYLDKNIGRVSGEILPKLAKLLFPASAEPTLPEQCLPVSFIHLRLLGGESLRTVQERMEPLARLFGMAGARLPTGTLYLILTSLTSTPGNLSSLARAQAAFFSLLLRRLSGALDRGESECSIRAELAGVWDIHGEGAAEAALRGARGYWRRFRDPHLGLIPLPFDLAEWMAENGLGGEMNSELALFPKAGGHPHPAALPGRLAAAEALKAALQSGGVGQFELGQTLAEVQGSLEAALEGITPWEAEALRPVHPLISSLVAWSERLLLLGEGETPVASTGREKLADWLSELLDSTSSGRLLVGGDTYLIFGADVTVTLDAVSAELAEPGEGEKDTVSLRVRFGGAEKRFRFDLSAGKDLLAAVRLAHQPDIRVDLFLRGENGLWRFAASRYLQPDEAHRAAWRRRVLEYLFEKFGGEEDQIRLEILKAVKG
jgi:hypothetical protein